MIVKKIEFKALWSLNEEMKITSILTVTDTENELLDFLKCLSIPDGHYYTVKYSHDGVEIAKNKTINILINEDGNRRHFIEGSEVQNSNGEKIYLTSKNISLLDTMAKEIQRIIHAENSKDFSDIRLFLSVVHKNATHTFA